MESKISRKSLVLTFIVSIIFLFFCYQGGYDHSINWTIKTVGEVEKITGLVVPGALMEHQILGENYQLKEEYAGGSIERSLLIDQILLSFLWLGLCVILAAATKLRRFAFFAILALLALFLNRLNLFEVGLFGIQSRIVLLIPFLTLVTPLVIFHEYRPKIKFPVRLLLLIALSALMLIGISDPVLFTDHLIAHSLFGWTLCAIIFLFIISEEIIFAILYVVTSTKGGKNNHVHFLILSLLYLGNIGLYYLNKSGLMENSFFLFDPFMLLAITALISLWSMKFKAKALNAYLTEHTFYLLILGLGLITLLFISHHMLRGNDAIYQAFDYLVLYFHLGIGVFFFLYVIANFIDPLIGGFQVHKIVYRERNLPYASARFVGLVAVVAFYLLGAQEPYNLLRGGYYNYLAQTAKDEGNPLLEKEYLLQAAFLGFNTHYANYKLAEKSLQEEQTFEAKMSYFNASQRFPSPYSLINYGNLDREINSNKVKAIYQEALRSTESGELKNNLGLILLENKAYERAIDYFDQAIPAQKWNLAPVVNKWYALNKIDSLDTTAMPVDYRSGNFGVKANILANSKVEDRLPFVYEELREAPFAHRQAYLLNSCYKTSHDSLEAFARRALELSQDRSYNQKLQLALGLHLYRHGNVNDAFTTLDYLIANAASYNKGRFLDVLAKLSLDQGAYQLSVDYFDRAIASKYAPARLSRIDALALQGDAKKIPDQLLEIVKANPGLTKVANDLLEKLEQYEVEGAKKRHAAIPNLETLSVEELTALARRNAFHEEQVVAVVDELSQREASGGYEILLSSIEINPYSSVLLKKYCLAALDWNLTDYADQALEQLQPLLSKTDFESFSETYKTTKKQLEDAAW